MGELLDPHTRHLNWLARELNQATLADPFSQLGLHPLGNDTQELRTYQPGATRVTALDQNGNVLCILKPVGEGSNLFVGKLNKAHRYQLHIDWGDAEQDTEDPYSFGPILSDVDLHLFAEGKHYKLNRALGAHCTTVDGIAGVRFSVWAPNARRVSVVGDFNQWDGRRHPMRPRNPSGVWELFVPRLQAGTFYKYEILGAHGLLPLKADPVGWQAEAAPGDSSVVMDPTPFEWHDDQWMAERQERHSHHAPISIYEVHASSWRRAVEAGNRSLSWQELGDLLIPYVEQLGFTHIELLPITAHPFGGSWGYQPIGMFAPQADLGSPREFAAFVDRCHQAGIGVIADWVPAHFPTDPHGLMRFDGTALYEHADTREGFHQDWNTLIYNMGRNEVHGFLLASALHWLEEYHLDGLRVDAVASMLYRDYSRNEGEWIPNRYGGRENLESIDFLRHLNFAVGERVPGAIVIAEESTAWPGVTQAVSEGGLGFSYKWNMGWMNDTLEYVKQDPIHRRYHHDKITFGLHYAFTERYILPLSHDEVVHGKGSLIGRMPGDEWQQFANLRAYFGFMWGHPGKKLLFMGGEFGQRSEWNHDAQVDWAALNDHLHRGVQQWVSDLNRFYRRQPALHSSDADMTGFTWIVGDDKDNCVFAFCRNGTTESAPPVLAVSNFTPVPRDNYRVGVPRLGIWRELLNSDSELYGGSNVGNGGDVVSVPEPSHGQSFSLRLTLPPLSTIFLVFCDREVDRLPA
ncbi:1,4-alpha-glucan branching protein GlgB [Gilvimarinus sp. F26214L]|uniref:1,4-alpha-glucan branching protein GlgB n=1 Tax=Gilvimarinus sp. DZF01 TaxID=3461371 RepID=UPI0040464565